MRGFAIVLGGVGLMAGAAQAGTEGEEAGMTINRINATDFEVVEDGNSEAGYFWCGASSLLERREGRPSDTRIYLKVPRGPSRTVAGRNAVLFTTDPAGLPADPGGFSLDVEQPGRMLLVREARRLCRYAFTRATK